MYGWFRRLLERRKRDPLNSRSAENQDVPSSQPASPSSSSSSPLHLVLNAAARWSHDFDVCVCHSAEDIADAQLLVSRLEARPHGLRCYLQLRDSAPGGAVPTELCQAVRSSHCWVLLITPRFLLDPWCHYQMHQALAEAPMSSRIIPLVLHVSRSEYPKELRFYYFIDLSRNPDRGYELVYKTVLKYLEDVCRNSSEAECSPDHLSQGSERRLFSSGQTHPDPETSRSLPTGEHPSAHVQPITESELSALPEACGPDEGDAETTAEDLALACQWSEVHCKRN